MKKWTKKEIGILRTFDKNTNPYVVKQSLPNRSVAAIRRKMQRVFGGTETRFSKSIEASFEVPIKELEKELKRRNSKLFYDFANSVIEAAQDFDLAIDHSSVIVDEASLVLVLSDNHFGKLTSVFSIAIAKERIMSLIGKIEDLTVGYEGINEIVIVLAGDEIEGEDIYQHQAHDLECCALDQVKAATETYFTFLLKLAEEVESYGIQVRVETVPGNHGRVSKTANPKTNWDNIIYQQLAMMAELVDVPNLIVNANMHRFHRFPVQDKIGMAFHHGTKHTGTPAMQKKHMGWMLTKDYDFMVHGHWHQFEIGTVLGVPVLKNGSLCGEDDLAEEMAAFDPPRQGWMLIEKGKPISRFGFFEWSNDEEEVAFGAASHSRGRTLSSSIKERSE